MTNARITRVKLSWRVRVSGHAAQYFADSRYGGTEAALDAARAWRDARWSGQDKRRKLSPSQVREIQTSREHYVDIAERHRISPNYVHKLRRRGLPTCG
jgi:hypothetical protein